MTSMNGRVGISGMSWRRPALSVAATALLALFVAVLALPLCFAMSTCGMACCETSSTPTNDHHTMPLAACGGGSGCGFAAARAAEDVVPFGVTIAVLRIGPAELVDQAPSPTTEDAALSQSRSTTRRLYVFNDAFLI